MLLDGKVALVTGGSRGIGRATVLALARSGAQVTFGYNDSDEEAEEVRSELGRLGQSARGIKADISIPTEAKRMVTEAIDHIGVPDILVNNAGAICQPSAWDSITDEVWNRTLGINLNGPYQMIRAVAPLMLQRRGGAIVNVSSTFGILGSAYVIAYTAAKAGVINMTRGFAKALAPTVRVNAIAPGIIDTSMTRAAGSDLVNALIADTPLRRVGTPEEIAQAIVFLSSGDASFITGAVLVIDGGHSLK